MNQTIVLLIDIGIITVLIVALAQFISPRLARWGNLTAAMAMGLAVITVIYRHEIGFHGLIGGAVALGAVLGLLVASKVPMIHIPPMVAFQHGAGGVAAFLISAIEVYRIDGVGWSFPKAAGLLGLVIGAATFSGSLVASGKLYGKFRQQPTTLPAHGLFVLSLVAVIAAICIYVGFGDSGRSVWGSILLVILSAALGWSVAVRIGGADMPVLISFLNATAGLAAAFCGIILGSKLLVAFGATVAASGSILTHMMCRAMNRSLGNIFTGMSKTTQTADSAADENEAPGDTGGTSASDETEKDSKRDPADIQNGAVAQTKSLKSLIDMAAAEMRKAKQVIIVPGYGMALGQAQFQIVELSRLMVSRGTEVRFAIHPVAGRMPGHMNVLLAEAEVSYDDLVEMEEINPRFKDTDITLVVGACDVVNPAAISSEGTTISGMPILHAHESRKVVVCNLDEKPGYSGVPNLLYQRSNVILLFGDAGQTIGSLLKAYQ